ncbi:MAG TPA: HD domain-containing protein [Acidobacteriaceae bacterium]
MIPTFREPLARLIREQARPIDKYGHQPRLYALAHLVGVDLQNDDDVLYAAAYLHDLGVFIGHRPEEPERLSAWDHVRYTLEKAPALLAQVGFPFAKVDAVLRAIEQHQPRDTPSTPEGIILRDADILEQLGAIGILRAVAKVGRDTRYSTFTQAIAFLHRNLDELPSQIRLESTRRMAAPRIEFLRCFLAQVEQESMDCLY